MGGTTVVLNETEVVGFLSFRRRTGLQICNSSERKVVLTSRGTPESTYVRIVGLLGRALIWKEVSPQLAMAVWSRSFVSRSCV